MNINIIRYLINTVFFLSFLIPVCPNIDQASDSVKNQVTAVPLSQQKKAVVKQKADTAKHQAADTIKNRAADTVKADTVKNQAADTVKADTVKNQAADSVLQPGATLKAQAVDTVQIEIPDSVLSRPRTYRAEELTRGERLFYGLAYPKDRAISCVSCHNTRQLDTLNWNPDALEISVKYLNKNAAESENGASQTRR